MKRTRESISYHSTVSIPLMVFVCESQQCHAALSIVITSSHRALVSPWMDNGNALSYVKTRDDFKDTDYKKLVRCFIHFSC